MDDPTAGFPAPPGARARLPVVVLAVALTGFAVLRAVPSAQAVGVGLLASGTAAVCGLALLRSTNRLLVRPFATLIGCGMLLWGVGTLAKMGTVAAGIEMFPGPGDALTVAAGPLAVAALLSLPRRADPLSVRAGPSSGVRGLLDAGLLSIAAGLVLWRVAFLGASSSVHPGPVLAAVVVAELLVLSVSAVVAVRELEPHLAVLAVATAAFVAADMCGLVVSPLGAVPSAPWAQLLQLVCWPVAAWGVLLHRPRRVPDDPSPMDVDPDARVTLLTTTSSLVLLGAGVVTILVQDHRGARAPMDGTSWAMLLVAIGLLWVRELVGTNTRAQLLATLHEDATTDPLTGLGNRRLLTRRLAEVRPHEPWCLIALDLDGFKGVNDLLGHTVGDRLLATVGEGLGAAAPRAAAVCRIGGDEFALLVPGRAAAAMQTAERLLAAVAEACRQVDGVGRVHVTASAGVTAVHGPFPAPAPDQEAGEGARPDPLSPLSAATAALRQAKTSGPGRIELFDTSAAAHRTRRLRLEERLRQAVRDDALDVQFQPVVELATGTVRSVEALARWTDPELGVIGPAEFVPLAEETGLVEALGELVLRRALAEAAEHRLPDLGLKVACNVSPLQLRVPGFAAMVESALAERGVPAGTLVVEVTEAVLVEEDSPAVDSLRRLAALGVTIAIDDFGTGYSALGYLRRLPAQMLKIDRSLTSALADEPQARAIASAVIDLGERLGVSIVVEGIETAEVAELATELGACFGQGTLYGWAMPMAEVVRLTGRPPSWVRLA